MFMFNSTNEAHVVEGNKLFCTPDCECISLAYILPLAKYKIISDGCTSVCAHVSMSLSLELTCCIWMCVCFRFLGEAVRIVCPGMGYPTPGISFIWRPKSLVGYTDFVKQFSPFGRNEMMKTLNGEPFKGRYTLRRKFLRIQD